MQGEVRYDVERDVLSVFNINFINVTEQEFVDAVKVILALSRNKQPDPIAEMFV